MIKYLKNIGFALLLVFAACDEEEAINNSILDSSTPVLSELDTWIRNEYTSIYNIEVKYRWDDSEVNNNTYLTPPKEEMVMPFLKVMKKIWINPYSKIGGENFIKEYVPKQLVLIGSASYNSNGAKTLGIAESGTKVTIFEINDFDLTDRSLLRRQFHTIHHEFAHILHQNKKYQEEYKKITPSGYTSNWYNVSNYIAREQGFISAYSKSNPDEDFAEFIATMLTNSKSEFDAIINGVTNEDSKNALKLKEQFIVNYMLLYWKIDIYKLQKEIYQQTESTISKPTLYFD